MYSVFFRLQPLKMKFCSERGTTDLVVSIEPIRLKRYFGWLTNKVVEIYVRRFELESVVSF